jgi:hypothetical protein
MAVLGLGYFVQRSLEFAGLLRGLVSFNRSFASTTPFTRDRAIFDIAGIRADLT